MSKKFFSYSAHVYTTRKNKKGERRDDDHAVHRPFYVLCNVSSRMIRIHFVLIYHILRCFFKQFLSFYFY